VNSTHFRQRGVGLIEVMLALALVMFAALVISNLQTNAFVSMKITETHFTVYEQSQDMLETLRANKADAKALILIRK